ncbi:beta family protein [Pelotomaculum propionicicum]|uniref:beta family protein n=1 Tax=Pelotomaculum propionicicum TaxID=258475 RepID=UPI003B7E4386
MAIYYPVIRWKLGERAALVNLTPAVKDQISPIIEFPFNCDYDDRKVTDFCNNASTDWGVGRPFYLDLSTVDFDDAPTGTDHPALELFRNANRLGLELIPIFNVDIDPDLLIAIQDAYTDGLFRYIALRITENEDDAAADEARDIIGETGINIDEVDLIIDLRDVSDGEFGCPTTQGFCP